MKITTKAQLSNLMKEFFSKKLESVNRSRRGEQDDYPEENEGSGTTYEALEGESVDRSNRGEETDGEYSDEDEGDGVTYESLSLETNLYSDSQADKVSGKEDMEHGQDIEKDTYEKELNSESVNLSLKSFFLNKK